MRSHHFRFLPVVPIAFLFGCATTQNTESVTVHGQTITKASVLAKLKPQMTREGFARADVLVQDALNATARKDSASARVAMRSLLRRDFFVSADQGTKAEDCVKKC